MEVVSSLVTSNLSLRFEAQAMKKVLILGAAGRDFHNFNVVFRDDPAFRVVALWRAKRLGVRRLDAAFEVRGPNSLLKRRVNDRVAALAPRVSAGAASIRRRRQAAALQGAFGTTMVKGKERTHPCADSRL